MYANPLKYKITNAKLSSLILYMILLKNKILDITSF